MAERGIEFKFTGVSALYETPDHPELIVDTADETIEISLATLVSYVVRKMPFGEPMPISMAEDSR